MTSKVSVSYSAQSLTEVASYFHKKATEAEEMSKDERRPLKDRRYASGQGDAYRHAAYVVENLKITGAEKA